jgi:hypothetical protein
MAKNASNQSGGSFSAFADAAVRRAVRSAAQAAALVLGKDAVEGMVNASTVNWSEVAGFSAGMAAVSILTSLATGLPEAKD